VNYVTLLKTYKLIFALFNWLPMKPSSKPAVRILLADDDRDDRYFFKKAIEEIPFATHLTIVVNGQELMDYLSENLNHLPDVLFLDLNMPCKNGLECLDEIKQNPKLKPVPVIIYSTSLRQETADTLFKSGAHYYMHKCEYDELAKSIENVLALLADNKGQPRREDFIINWQEI
jgi:CheY-like chemotaxis protein